VLVFETWTHIHKRELTHDDFRRAHYDFRRSYYDFRMTSVTPVPAELPVPSAFGNKASGGSEEGDNADQEQDSFHIQ